MRGLLVKDLCLTLKNKRLLVVILFLAVMLTVLKGETAASFVISFVTALCGTLVLNTISIDEFDKSVAFLMTMPINKGIYAAEKYVFALGSGLVGCVISSVFYIIMTSFSFVDILQQALLIFFTLSLIQMIVLPIQFRFGSDIGKVVLLGGVAFFMVSLSIITKVGGENLLIWIDRAENLFLQWVDSSEKWLLYLLTGVIWVIFVGISLLVSESIIKKKEY